MKLNDNALTNIMLKSSKYFNSAKIIYFRKHIGTFNHKNSISLTLKKISN
jgi:hypothetical protein